MPPRKKPLSTDEITGEYKIRNDLFSDASTYYTIPKREVFELEKTLPQFIAERLRDGTVGHREYARKFKLFLALSWTVWGGVAPCVDLEKLNRKHNFMKVKGKKPKNASTKSNYLSKQGVGHFVSIEERAEYLAEFCRFLVRNTKYFHRDRGSFPNYLKRFIVRPAKTSVIKEHIKERERQLILDQIEEEARRSYSEDPSFYSLDPHGDELGEEWLENELAYQAQLEAGDDQIWV